MYFIPIKSNFTEKRGAPFPMYPTPQMVIDIGAFIPSQNFSQIFLFFLLGSVYVWLCSVFWGKNAVFSCKILR